MKALIIAEHDNKTLKGATRALVTAALQTADEVDVLVAGAGCAALASEAAGIAGINKVLFADHPDYAHQLAEPLANLVVAQAAPYNVILAAASTTGKNFLPRVAALLDVAQISEIMTVIDRDTFVRPIYAGNALATVLSADAVKVMTVRTSAFEQAPDSGSTVSIEAVTEVAAAPKSAFVSEQLNLSTRPELGAARVVISGGRGLGSVENFALLEPLADKLGAAIGASRAAVDAGYAPNDMQVGQTGKVVAPELYIAVGISGAIQHLAGMKDSKVIVAINKDPDAPIIQVADYALIGDLFEILPELTAKL